MKKLKIIFSTLVFTAGLALSSIAQANDIKIGVSFRMLSDVGYKHGELITDTVEMWNKDGVIKVEGESKKLMYDDTVKDSYLGGGGTTANV